MTISDMNPWPMLSIGNATAADTSHRPAHLMSRTMKQMTATTKPTLPMEAARTSRCSCSGVLAASVMTSDMVFPYSVFTPTATTKMEPDPSFSCNIQVVCR